MENLSGVVLLYKISENLLESKPFKTSRELPYFFAKLALCLFISCIYVICIEPPRDIQLNLEHFFRKTILIEKNISSHDVLNSLNSIKFL